MMTDKRPVIFFWDMLGPYHCDRLKAVAEHLADRVDVMGVQWTGVSDIYGWQSQPGEQEAVITLFEAHQDYKASSRFSRYSRLVKYCLERRPKAVFVCHYERPEVFFAAVRLRFAGIPVFVMQASKFDDYQRFLPREVGKSLLYAPYNGAVAGSPRTRDYLRFLGLYNRPIEIGYDTVSLRAMRELAAQDPDGEGRTADHADRDFVIIARLVEKKNLFMALAAYRRYLDSLADGDRARRLIVIGTGPLEQSLKTRAQELALDQDKVVWRGYLERKDIANQLLKALALILPSTEEQFGLVVNEALAFDLPILISVACGARDELVRVEENGFLFEPDNPEGLSRLMQRLAQDEALFQSLREGARKRAPLADASRFAEAVEKLLLSCSVFPSAST